MSHLSFYHLFPVTDIEPNFGSEKARVSPTKEGGVGGGHRANCRGRRHRTVNYLPPVGRSVTHLIRCRFILFGNLLHRFNHSINPYSITQSIHIQSLNQSIFNHSINPYSITQSIHIQSLNQSIFNHSNNNNNLSNNQYYIIQNWYV
jgi:hypothetical protein